MEAFFCYLFMSGTIRRVVSQINPQNMIIVITAATANRLISASLLCAPEINHPTKEQTTKKRINKAGNAVSIVLCHKQATTNLLLTQHYPQTILAM